MKSTVFKVLVLVITVLSLATAALTAHAADVETCEAAIQQTLNDLANATINGGNPERTRESLESALTGALTKLDEGKYEDALQKLVDFRTKIEQLQNAAKPKISTEDATLLLNDVDAAISCVQELIDQSATV